MDANEREGVDLDPNQHPLQDETSVDARKAQQCDDRDLFFLLFSQIYARICFPIDTNIAHVVNYAGI
jgi:hypothetical protein